MGRETTQNAKKFVTNKNDLINTKNYPRHTHKWYKRRDQNLLAFFTCKLTVDGPVILMLCNGCEKFIDQQADQTKIYNHICLKAFTGLSRCCCCCYTHLRRIEQIKRITKFMFTMFPFWLVT